MHQRLAHVYAIKDECYAHRKLVYTAARPRLGASPFPHPNLKLLVAENTLCT